MLAGVRRSLEDWSVSLVAEPWTEAARAVDFKVTLKDRAGSSQAYPTVVKLGRMDASRASAMALPEERPVLVLAPYVPAAAGQVLRARGVDFIDAVGNMSLALDGRSIDTLGHKPVRNVAAVKDPTSSRAMTRSGAMVVFALLSWTELVAGTVRQIAEASRTSVGTVHMVLDALAGGGYLHDGETGRALNRGGELLDRWAEAYAVNLYGRLALGTYALADQGQLAGIAQTLTTAGAQLGGELAGSRLDAHLRPGTVTFYVDELPAGVLAQYRLRRDDVAGTVAFRRRFWRTPGQASTLVPSPLVYADMLASGDPRQREHARRIRGTDDRLVVLDRS